MDCEEIAEKLLNGERLEETEKRHLHSCPDCKELYETLIETKSIWEEKEDVPSSYIAVDPVMRIIVEKERSLESFLSFRPKSGVSAMYMAVSFILSFLLFESNFFRELGEFLTPFNLGLSAKMEHFFSYLGSLF
ncbi:hypothetical protein [Metabacillus sp. RGM 3146]|uniref:hypothetical protein n=1 Tax=Metabacillus sp. RGM 3146 TaxID=3401092 RepID=UPI003B9B662F